MDKHSIIWTQAAPFWAEATTDVAGAKADFSKPSILRFTTDSFMDEFYNVLETDPFRLGEYRVRRETWRGILNEAEPETPAKSFALPLQRMGLFKRRAANGVHLPTKPATAPAGSAVSQQPLKLYQPAHQRYYLVNACLVCQTAGLPDRAVEAARQDKVSFLIRRLFPNSSGAGTTPAWVDGSWNGWTEHAWVPGRKANVWSPLATSTAAIAGEERNVLFPANYNGPDIRRRRLLAGLIPAGKREEYMGAGTGAPGSTPNTGKKTARKVLLRTEVIEPWKALIARSAIIASSWQKGTNDERAATDADKAVQLTREREQIQTVSWYVLLDFVTFLETYLENIYKVVKGQKNESDLSEAESRVFTRLTTMGLSAPLTTKLTAGSSLSIVASSLADALNRITPFKQGLDTVEMPYLRATTNSSYPNFLFPLADPEHPGNAPLPTEINLGTKSDEETADLAGDPTAGDNDYAELLDDLAVLIVRALPEESNKPEPAVPIAATPPKDPRNGWFTIRCLYERPGCGPLHEDVLSEPTEPFQIAGYFDPDAPARPIRIGLPIDTTPAGLRKFNKNTAFEISDVLCGQIQRMKGMTFGDLIRSVLPWPLHKDLSVPDGGPCKAGGGNIGTICSLSIPIITICALILLLIMVTLLDIIFRWLPFLMICFPLPGLKKNQ